MSAASYAPPRLLAAAALRFYPQEFDIDRELKRLDIGRILIGLFAFVRIAQIAQGDYILTGAYGPLLLVTSGVALCLLIGFMTPIMSIALAILMRHVDNVYSTNTLGTSVLIQVLILFALLRAGRYYSLDFLLAKLNDSFYRRIYGKPSQTEVKSAYAMVFLIYAIISFAALWFHIKDPYWVGGTTVKSMFTSTYLCKHPELFRELDRNFPALLGVMSIGAGIAQSVFQFLMIPLMFFRPGRFFVRWHGMFFFVVSLLLLNLSYLPHYELVLWWLILFPTLASTEQSESQDCRLPVATYAFYSVYSVLVIVFLSTIHWGSLKNSGRSMNTQANAYSRIITRAAGMEVPIVFDTVDLEMGNRWSLLYRKLPGQADWELTPTTTFDGRKSNYGGRDIFWAGNHNTDVLYFGTTLPFRRRMIGLTGPKLNEFVDKNLGRPAIERLIRFDYRIKKLQGAVRYRLIVMDTSASKVSLFESTEQRLQGRPILWRWYTFDGTELR